MRNNLDNTQVDNIDGSRALFYHATEGILVTNKEGEITSINPAAEKMFGYEPGELVGKKIEILIPRRYSKQHENQRDSFQKNPHARSMGIGLDLFGRRKDESEFPVEVSLSPFSSGEGDFVIAFIIDITIRKRQEEFLKKTHRELQYYTEELKASNAELENFAYISSHDLQEPLRKIQSFGDRLKTNEADKLTEQGQDYLNRMLNAAQRMQNLINDLLAFSRLSTRSLPFEPTDLNQVIREVLSDMEVTIENTKATVNIDPLPVVEAEPTQMRQLFQNLISNAIKFRKDDTSPAINIYSKKALKKSSDDPDQIEIFFEDNGIGFDEKYNDRIYNIFQRLEGRKFEGSGIGLAICRKIAMRHGGNISAKSQIGKGSTFIVTLAEKQFNQPI